MKCDLNHHISTNPFNTHRSHQSSRLWKVYSALCRTRAEIQPSSGCFCSVYLSSAPPLRVTNRHCSSQSDSNITGPAANAFRGHKRHVHGSILQPMITLWRKRTTEWLSRVGQGDVLSCGHHKQKKSGFGIWSQRFVALLMFNTLSGIMNVRHGNSGCANRAAAHNSSQIHQRQTLSRAGGKTTSCWDACMRFCFMPQ